MIKPLKLWPNLVDHYRWTPYFVEGNDPEDMHRKMAEAMESCLREIHVIQREARQSGSARREIWPMIILRSPKGWACPKETDGNQIEGSWRAHQVPLSNVHTSIEQLKILENWLLSYKPEELFDNEGRLISALQELAPTGALRMSASPHVNGGLIKKNLRMPDFKSYANDVKRPAKSYAMNTKPLGEMLRDVMSKNNKNFRVFGPD